MNPSDGYRDAFYAIAAMLDIAPDGTSPRQTFEERLQPAIARLVNGSSALSDAAADCAKESP